MKGRKLFITIIKAMGLLIALMIIWYSCYTCGQVTV